MRFFFLLCRWISGAAFGGVISLAAYFSIGHAAASEHFDYQHQAQWHESSGDMQSPIAIKTVDAELDDDDDDDDDIRLHVMPTQAAVIDTGHAVQVTPVTGNWAKIRGRKFQLQQFHFHAPSEHTIDGVSYPLEGHFVFKSKDGRLAVIAVMFKEGEANETADTILGAFRRGGTSEPVPLDAARLVPSTNEYFRYLGSLTTPPLSQNVEWTVLAKPMSMSRAQLDGFAALYSGNNRTQQPLNGRPLLHFVGH